MLVFDNSNFSSIRLSPSRKFECDSNNFADMLLATYFERWPTWISMLSSLTEKSNKCTSKVVKYTQFKCFALGNDSPTCVKQVDEECEVYQVFSALL